MTTIFEPDRQNQSIDPFERANGVMTEVVEAIPGIEPVRTTDLALFDQYFNYERVMGRETHGNGFSYMLQMMNRIGPEDQPKLGYRYNDGTNLLPIVTYPSKADPNQLGIYFLRPMGSDVIATVVALAQQLRDNGFNYPIYVKKIFPEQATELIASGFSPIEVLPWHPSALSEDDTFPELIYSRQATMEAIDAASRRKNLKKSYLEVKRLYKNADVRFTEEGFEEKAWAITQEFFASSVVKEGKPNVSSPEDYRNMIHHNPIREGLTRKILEVDGQPLAYYIAEATPGSSTTNFYALISLRNRYNYLSDLGILHILENMATPLLNMGGSEDLGIHGFKQKYLPVQERQMHWVVKPD